MGGRKGGGNLPRRPGNMKLSYAAARHAGGEWGRWTVVTHEGFMEANYAYTSGSNKIDSEVDSGAGTPPPCSDWVERMILARGVRETMKEDVRNRWKLSKNIFPHAHK